MKYYKIFHKEFIAQFIKYSCIGVINTLTGFTLFYLFYSLLKLQSISLFFATLLGAMVSYFLNSRFNFKLKVSKRKYFIFLAIMLLISYFVGWIGDNLNLPYLLTFIISIFISLPLGFLFSKYIIFK